MGTVEQRVKALENERDLLWREVRALRERGARQWGVTVNRSLLGNVVGHYLALPGLRGFWPMSSFNEGGDAYDLSGQGRVLTYNGDPTYTHDELAPCIAMDGASDRLLRADEAGFDILGTESYVASAVRGLTLGGWFYVAASGSDMGLMGKTLDLYQLTCHIATTAYFYVNGGGTSVSLAMASGAWRFVVGRFDPSTEMKIWVNANTNTKVTGVPAAINNTVDSFYIGDGGSTYLNGRASLCFLCATIVGDNHINALYQRSRALFGI